MSLNTRTPTHASHNLSLIGHVSPVPLPRCVCVGLASFVLHLPPSDSLGPGTFCSVVPVRCLTHLVCVIVCGCV